MGHSRRSSEASLFSWCLPGAHFGLQNGENVPKWCPEGYPGDPQRGAKIHQNSLKVGPWSQWAPQGTPGMPPGAPGPPKWGPGPSKVTIWTQKNINMTQKKTIKNAMASCLKIKQKRTHITHARGKRRRRLARHGGGVARRALGYIYIYIYYKTCVISACRGLSPHLHAC